MEYNVDFTVEPLKKRCHGHKARVKPFHAKRKVMDSPKTYQNCEEIRLYWRLNKRKWREVHRANES